MKIVVKTKGLEFRRLRSLRGPVYCGPVHALIKGICGVLDETSRGCQAGGFLSWGLSGHKTSEPGVSNSVPSTDEVK